MLFALKNGNRNNNNIDTVKNDDKECLRTALNINWKALLVLLLLVYPSENRKPNTRKMLHKYLDDYEMVTKGVSDTDCLVVFFPGVNTGVHDLHTRFDTCQ